MRASSLLPVVLTVWLGAGCAEPSTRPVSPSAPESVAPSEAASSREPEPERFGGPIGAASELHVSDLLDDPRSHEGEVRIVRGYVRRACSRRGCWMELAGGPSDGPGVRVTFQDYGFFVPTDSAGADARIEGRIEATELPPAAVEHLESEGASVPERDLSGGARELRIVATGVELYR